MKSVSPGKKTRAFQFISVTDTRQVSAPHSRRFGSRDSVSRELGKFRIWREDTEWHGEKSNTRRVHNLMIQGLALTVIEKWWWGGNFIHKQAQFRYGTEKCHGGLFLLALTSSYSMSPDIETPTSSTAPSIIHDSQSRLTTTKVATEQ